MAYATATDMQDRFALVELIGLSNQNDLDAETINTATLSVALSDGSAIIDAILAPAMPTPLAPVPPLLVALCCDLARYRLHTGPLPDDVSTRYDAAIEMLGQIAAGTYSITG